MPSAQAAKLIAMYCKVNQARAMEMLRRWEKKHGAIKDMDDLDVLFDAWDARR